MKQTFFIIFAVAGVAGCAVQDGTPQQGAAIPMKGAAPVPSIQHGSQGQADGFASEALSQNQYEVTYSGHWLGSRDAIEGALLYRSALLAKQQRASWFRFLHLPGETGPDSHPARHAPSFGRAYGHWQPHWRFRTESGWQPWRPESGSSFWADTADGRGVKLVEVHAMIELGRGPLLSKLGTEFEVAAVLKDLRSTFGNGRKSH